MPFCEQSCPMSISRHRVPNRRHTYGCFILTFVILLARNARSVDGFMISDDNVSVTVAEKDGHYEIKPNNLDEPIVRSYVGAQINQRWVSSKEYPKHRITRSTFSDTLGHGRQLTVASTGLINQPDLVYTLRVYDDSPFGDLEVQVQNRTSKTANVQAIRSMNAFGENVVNLGGPEISERVLSDWFTENRVKVSDLGDVPERMHVAVGSQLIYNRRSKRGVFFGALNADRFITFIHLQVDKAQNEPKVKSYTIDSTGTLGVRTVKWFRELPAADRMQLDLPVAPQATLSSERLMFAVADDYHAALENYGAAIRKLHDARVNGPSLMGWWTSPMEYNTTVNEGQAYTNIEWLAQHLKQLGYDFIQIDSPYTYSLGEYTHANTGMYPHGLRALGSKVSSRGLNFGIWVAPFQVGEQSWVFKHHKEWLVRNARGLPIKLPGVTEVQEPFSILDPTHPGAQEYLRQTYRTMTREWGVKYIKLDYMDMTAMEGNYYRPHTTALEALKIGLQVIRDAVGEDVFLDKDGSPMLTPVGIVDEGRVSGDSGHSFAIWKDRASSIMSRYYMHRNFFVIDPDAFTLLKEVPGAEHDEFLPEGPPLTLDEAQLSIVLAATTGGMFEIGDDLPSLSKDPERLALLRNKDLIQMVKLGKASEPLDLMNYSPDDLQPSVSLLHEEERQSMLTVFNWSEQSRSHEFTMSDLGLRPEHVYKLYDVLNKQEPVESDGKNIVLKNQRPHSVRLIKIVDESQSPKPPAVNFEASEHGKANESLAFSATSETGGVFSLNCHWDFGDGVTAEGARVTHAYTLVGTYTARVTVEGLDGIPAEKQFSIEIAGYAQPGPRGRYLEKGEHR